MLDIFQVVAMLAAHQGRSRVAAMYLGHYRARLAERGAEMPADLHAPWQSAQKRLADPSTLLSPNKAAAMRVDINDVDFKTGTFFNVAAGLIVVILAMLYYTWW